jgi:hypothetical protein
MHFWAVLFAGGIFVTACALLSGLWLLCGHSHPRHEEKPPKKPLLSNWR